MFFIKAPSQRECINCAKRQSKIVLRGISLFEHHEKSIGTEKFTAETQRNARAQGNRCWSAEWLVKGMILVPLTYISLPNGQDLWYDGETKASRIFFTITSK
jgi:hypothetical protein